MTYTIIIHIITTNGYLYIYVYRCVVLGMGDGSMTTLTIADPEKDGIRYMDGNFSIFLKLTKKGITFSIV